MQYLYRAFCAFMKIQLITFAIALIACRSYSQTNLADSTVKVQAYWNLGDKFQYAVSEYKYSIEGLDTTTQSSSTNNISVTVLDVGEHSFTLEWLVKGMLGAESDSAAMKDHKMANDLKIVFETNKSGGLEKVVNWKYVADYGLKASMIYLNDKLNRREKRKFIKKMKETVFTESGIQTTLAKNIDLFCFFHGGHYDIGRLYSDTISVVPIYSDKPVKTHVTTSVNGVYPEYSSYAINYRRAIEEKDIIESTNNLLQLVGNDSPVDKNSFHDLNNETTISALFHDSGWLIQLYTESKFTLDGKTTVKATFIQMAE
jgi:hypothetical protein